MPKFVCFPSEIFRTLKFSPCRALLLVIETYHVHGFCYIILIQECSENFFKLFLRTILSSEPVQKGLSHFFFVFPAFCRKDTHGIYLEIRLDLSGQTPKRCYGATLAQVRWLPPCYLSLWAASARVLLWQRFRNLVAEDEKWRKMGILLIQIHYLDRYN